MPEESEYSDDVDFMDTDEDTLTALFTTAKDVFSEWNLQINEAKTEYVHFRIADRDELMEDGKTPLRGNEEWCTTKLLGSLMCSVKDVGNRCMLGNIAFQSFKKVWMNSRITLEKKIKVYEAQVVSIIMYNSSCWAAPAVVLEKLDICHRKHLRTIMNIRRSLKFCPKKFPRRLKNRKKSNFMENKEKDLSWPKIEREIELKWSQTWYVMGAEGYMRSIVGYVMGAEGYPGM